MKAAILASLALLLAGSTVYANGIIATHLDSDQEAAREVRKLKAACGRPRMIRIGAMT